ncbi:hypothetical protein DFH08DRAFT_100554 [Mycena albidolilacea]|uniref:F-box domain-containing protein n=1 Tax=Mycena albidolilacea TaxID=1033008 RepID=A0AAD7A810_9AGAR|nr:hypothetical protein DFH08DRAFT_100554 [Mycena albidolilacea]
MFLSFLRNLACMPSNYADYDPLGTIEPSAWPVASITWTLSPIMRLPPELVHLIISCVDSTMLATCSLVCTLWMPHARARMFRRLSISVSNAHRFGRLFEPLSCVSFGSHVREIELDGSIICDFWTTQVLPKFIVDFPHLNTLTLFGAVPPPLPSAFQVITHLEINYSALAPRITCTISPVAGFVSMFPRLEVLKLTQENGAYPDFGGLSEPIHPPPPHLRRVDLDNAVFLPWITSATHKPPISAIRLDISRSESIKALESLRCLSTSLQSLELIISDLDVGASFLKPNRLDPTTQLRTLRIQADYSQAAHILLKLFSYIDTSCLAEVSLYFAIPYLDSPDPSLLPWSDLDAALAALPSLRRLTVVQVLVSPQGWRSRINQRMLLPDAAHRMPLCHRGFGVGKSSGAADLDSRPPSRAAGSRRWLSDLHAF